jgi:hypothetical protein
VTDVRDVVGPIYINITEVDCEGSIDCIDAFPKDPIDKADTDGDGIGNNGDPDDDNDGVPDSSDAYPLDPSRSPGGIDGGWSAWNATAPCSASCGGGQQLQTRSCTAPAPSGGGAPCTGDSTRSVACNQQPCDGAGSSGSGAPPDPGACGCDGNPSRYRICDYCFEGTTMRSVCARLLPNGTGCNS